MACCFPLDVLMFEGLPRIIHFTLLARYVHGSFTFFPPKLLGWPEDAFLQAKSSPPPPPPPPPPKATLLIEMEEEEGDLEDREDSDQPSDEFDEIDESSPGDDEEEIEESISGIFNILGNALASKSGRVDVMDILTHGSSTESHSQKSRQDTRSSIHRWMHDTNAYEQTVSDRWANAFDVQESEQAWIEAVQATRVRKEG